MRASIFLALLLAAVTGGCEHSPMGLPTVKMSIGNRSYELEVANTPAAEEKGLMERDSMAADHGMIFVFPSERVLDFWMKNTRFALDIVFADAKGRVVSIRQMKPYDLNTTSSIYPAQYAIELNRGQAAACGVKVGDTLAIPDKAKKSGGS